MRDDLGVEEFIEDVGTRVRSIDRYEVTSYQVLVLFRGQRCLPPRCSALQTSCCVRYLALVTFEALDRPSIRWKPSWRSEAASGGPSRSGSNPPVEYQPRPKRLEIIWRDCHPRRDLALLSEVRPGMFLFSSRPAGL